MSGLTSGQHEWSSQYAVLDALGDYIEWTFTLSSGEAAQLNTASSSWIISNRTMVGPGNCRMLFNGYHIGSVSHGTFGNNFVWSTVTGGVGSGPSSNVFLTGTNVLRAIMLPPYSNDVKLDFIAIDLDMNSPGPSFGGSPDFYENTEMQYFRHPAGLPGLANPPDIPSWYAGHGNPTYNHSIIDAPATAPTLASHSQPTFIFKATAGTIGHADEVSIAITSISRTSSNDPLVSPLEIDVDVSVGGGASGQLMYLNYYPGSTNLYVVNRFPVSGGVGTVSMSMPFSPPDNVAGGDPPYYPLGSARIQYIGDATHAPITDPSFFFNGFETALVLAEVYSPTIADIAINRLTKYNFSFEPAFEPDTVTISDPLNALYQAREQTPTTYLWDDGDGGSGAGATLSHEYPHIQGNYTVTLETTGLYNGTFSWPQPSSFGITVQVGPVIGWLHFTSELLDDSVFENFTDLNFAVSDSTEGVFLNHYLQTDGVQGYLIIGIDTPFGTVASVDSYVPSGGNKTSTVSIGATSIPYQGFPVWCFDVDKINIWGASAIAGFPGSLGYGPLGSTTYETVNFPSRVGYIPLSLSVDPSTGLLYAVWIPGGKVDQIDPVTRTIIQTFTPSIPSPDSAVALYVAASSGVLALAGINQSFQTVVWIVDTATGVGQDDMAFPIASPLSLGLPTSIDFLGGDRTNREGISFDPRIRPRSIASIRTE
jgi:hypothetical protein